MDTLFDIRTAFAANCFNLLKISRAYDSLVHITPDFRQHPDKLDFEPHMPSLDEMYEIRSESPNLVEQMIHSQMIQEWFLFLEKIFEQRLQEIFSGGNSSEIKVELQLTFPEDAKTDLAEVVQRRAQQNFGLEPYKKKLDIVLKLLGKPVNANDENLRAIKKHKVIRDVIQHSNGILRERDFQELALSEFTLVGDTMLDQKLYVAGDTVTITHLEIEQLEKTLLKAAKAFIPDPK